MTAPPTQGPTTLSTEYPGKTLGIVGFVLVFVGASLIGLILSIIGFKQSKNAGRKNNIALAGIWINTIEMTIIPIILVIMMITSYGGITAKADTAMAQNNASSVQSAAESYYAEKGRYPTLFDDFISTDLFVIKGAVWEPKSTLLLNNYEILNNTNGRKTIWYQYGKNNRDDAIGGRVQYWDFINDRVSSDIIYVGKATQDSVFSNLK